MKLKTSNCDQTQKLKLWWNLKTQIVTKLKFGQTKFHRKTQTQIVMKLKNSKCDETQKLELWSNWKTQFVIKRKKSNFDETLKLKLW